MAENEIDSPGLNTAPSSLLWADAPEIKDTEEGTDVLFRSEFDSDEDPPPSDDDEATNEDDQISEWLHMFEGGKELEVFKAAPVKSRISKTIEKEFMDSVKEQKSTSTAPHTTERKLISDAMKAPFETKQPLQQQHQKHKHTQKQQQKPLK